MGAWKDFTSDLFQPPRASMASVVLKEEAMNHSTAAFPMTITLLIGCTWYRHLISRIACQPHIGHVTPE